MSDSRSSAPQRCAVCFCKGCEWVCVGAGAGGAEPNMFFIKDERRESFYCLRHLCQVWGRVCLQKGEIDLWPPHSFVVTYRLIHTGYLESCVEWMWLSATLGVYSLGWTFSQVLKLLFLAHIYDHSTTFSEHMQLFTINICGGKRSTSFCQ